MMIESVEVLMNEQAGITAVCENCRDDEGGMLVIYETKTQKTEDFMNADLASLLHGDIFPEHHVIIYRQIFPN
jgi:hypothetical protein